MIRSTMTSNKHRGNRLSVAFMLEKIAEGCDVYINRDITERMKSLKRSHVEKMYDIYLESPTKDNAGFILHFLLL